MDQPHIWLMEYAVCDQARIQWNAIRQANAATEAMIAAGES